jgi:peroxiredoxin
MDGLYQEKLRSHFIIIRVLFYLYRNKEVLKMKYYLRLPFVSIIICLFLSGCTTYKEPIKEEPVSAIKKEAAVKSTVVKKESKNLPLAHNFELLDLKEKQFSLESYRNKQPVVLFFWTTWCPFCRQELKAVNSMYPQLQKDGLEVLTIDVEEPASRVESFLKKNALFLPVLLDKNAAVARDYELMGVPTIMIVNKRGNIVFEGDHFPKEIYKKLLEE